MPRKPNISGKKWTPSELRRLKQLVRTIDTPDIAKDLERSESAVRTKASEEHISLKPRDR
ncbi:hypothetical protein [Legionella sp. 227]|uniref:hypothetical protein n=1 Tax=Legionella sp. 227 TaxID=3367288 RepID=UPI00370D3435